MRTDLRWVAGAVLMFLLGCASEQKRTEQAATRLQSATNEFYALHRRYPRSLAELQAAAGARPLDLRAFASIDFKPDKHGGLNIWAVPKKKSEPDELGVLLSVSPPMVTHCGVVSPVEARADK